MQEIVNRVRLTRVVDDCYPSSYKIFTVNSYDGYTIDKSLGLFVSLGITSSLNTMKSLLDQLRNSFSEHMTIAEIESRMINGRYVNKLVREDVDYQYQSENFTDGDMLTRYEGYELLNKLLFKISESKDLGELSELLSRSDKLCKLLCKFESGQLNWDDYSLYIVDNPGSDIVVSAVSNLVNYTQYKEEYKGSLCVVHKRIGIYIEY